ncbi:WecB/TagA/CpsF family glycosyltransferase [Conexibacter sp. SYSU D00693]|uniref:WecB/TagA/CpsF family glycosyltransferase n=1 Tax=Conexibacter sp. SYSU D00693 TaxID=2812560 RepID=UPI00196B799E|nr:WecB/TagA/CpsF family glycosyltransferase [Conexibacter sp. SYSU D00693]
MAAPIPAPIDETPSGFRDLAVVDSTPPTTDLLGVPLALTDYDETMDWMDQAVAREDKGYICVAATHTVVACQDDPELREAVLKSSLTVPDGQPLRWALNAMGEHLEDRVYGPELMARYCERSAQTGTRMFLYGGRNQGALVQLALNLRKRFPGLKIVGGYSPPFRELDAEEEDAIAEEINRSGADVVWVGIGVPKQEKWMARMRDRLDAPVLVGVGAAFDFHAGLVPQAPLWVQHSGLEWAYRLAHEPRRLWKRYAINNPRFVAGFAKQYAGHLRHGPVAH